MKKRRLARKLALQALYGLEISGNNVDSALKWVEQESQGVEQVYLFSGDLVKKTFTGREDLDKEISTVVKNWDLERVALIDRIVLRLALCEFLYFETIPPKVTINEAIDLAKEFSTEQSGRFVNGILDALYKKCLNQGRIKKSGRGLYT
ncbi:transcription antitermination factor NusB [candidate division KSB1 bacterium]|nr:MAG: transcription antitermination factor NusB [candidate division KSB1 bacterium]